MTALKVSVGARIRALRKQKGLTQDEVAELAGIDPKSLSRIEGGKFNPSLETLEVLATALDAPIGQLFPESADSPYQSRFVLLDAALNCDDQQIGEIVNFINRLRRRISRKT